MVMGKVINTNRKLTYRRIIMDFLRKLYDSFINLFNDTTPVVKAEESVVAKAVEAKAEVNNVEVKAEPAKKAPAKRAPKSAAKAEVAEKRTRKGGKFVGDDKSTPEVNEAFKDGKAPTKKAPAKKKPSMKVAK